MSTLRLFAAVSFVLIWGLPSGVRPAVLAAELELRPGDHLCLVGNALGERLQFTPDWEALLYQRVPDHELVVRNLCFPADEPFHRDRSLNFGTPDEHLAHSKADVILYFFGANEAFRGPSGRDKFIADLTRLVRETKLQNYSGRGAPRMVLISPIAHEDLGNPHITDGQAHNGHLESYTAAMKAVAAEEQVGFVDLFTPTRELFARTSEPLTVNGIHLNEAGYRALAPLLDAALFGPATGSKELSAALLSEIQDKNFHWWHRYRAVNGYSIYGTRGLAGSDGTYNNRDVMERERAILDEMCANRDQRIWRIVRGESVPAQVDDSNTLPFLVPKTNVGGTNDPNRRAGKLGSLDYLPAAEQRQYFELAPGYQIDLVASEEDFPELANPVALNFDSRGRLWVATMPSYPQWQPKTKLDDKLLILQDHNGDGRADQCTVFAGGLHQPTGFELGAGGVFVAQQPDILFLTDQDGDDRADVRVRRLSGFDTADSHHGLAAFEWGPDGALYFQEGTFKQSQVESPYGPVRLGDAGVWRYEPRTEKLHVHVSLAFANPWGHIFDAWGQNFIADASPGENYWATPISGYVAFPDKHPGGSRAKNLDWGGSKSDKEYPPFFPKRIRPSSGCEIVASRQFPPEAQGNYLVNNVIGDLGVLQHTMFEQGSGFGAREITPLLLSKHGNFRPVDLQFGPDGALYIVDWHNALIGHLQHNLREPYRDHSHGRIWRVRYTERPLLTPPPLDQAEISDLLQMLTEPEDRARYRVRRELAQRERARVLAALQDWVGPLAAAPAEAAPTEPWELGEEHRLLEALWLYQTLDEVRPELLARLLHSPDHRARAAATRVLCEWRERLPDTLAWLAAGTGDPHPRVRLEAVRALSFIHTSQSLELALDVLKRELDPFLEYTLDETLRAIESGVAGPAAALAADDAAHAHAGHEHAPGPPAGPPPLVFLDKPAKIVQFQLARLPASRLLAIPRSPDDDRFRPVYHAILTRPGVARQDRQEALGVLAALTRTPPIDLLLQAIGELREEASPAPPPRNARRAARQAREPRAAWSAETAAGQLASLLLEQPRSELSQRKGALRAALESSQAAVRTVAFAALVAAGEGAEAWQRASATPQGRIDLMSSLPLLSKQAARAALREEVLACLEEGQPVEVRRAALAALATLPNGQAENFHRATELMESAPLRAAAVRTLLAIPREARSREDARRLAQILVAHAESTPAAQRTTDEFLDALQLADEMLALLPVGESRAFRERLRAVTVRVVRIKTVHEEMRYDTPYFAVEAGRPVQVVLRNDDLMPHNLLVTMPGKLRDVAMLAATMSPQPDAAGYAYVPKSPDVLFATRLVEPHRQGVLTFTAPREPGAYPYVCTFPNHWMRMYGVMVVVPDLDEWLAQPQQPADPLGSTREFVQSWTVGDFEEDLAGLLRGRSREIGQRIFQEATCAQCHKVRGAGGAVGPELTEVYPRLKQDPLALLREVLDPSHKVDPKFALYNLTTSDGRVISGILTDQNAESVTVISNPEKPQPQVLAREEIDELVKSSASLMPKGLLDRFSKDEIGELLAYLMSP